MALHVKSAEIMVRTKPSRVLKKAYQNQLRVSGLSTSEIIEQNQLVREKLQHKLAHLPRTLSGELERIVRSQINVILDYLG